MNTAKRSYKEDYENGTRSEDELLDILNIAFEDTYTKNPRYSTLDFTGKGSYVEIKTRTCSVNRFDTTILPYNKIEGARNAGRPVYFVFRFVDCITYIEFNDEQFRKYTRKMFCRQTRSDYNDTEKMYVYIPISDLTLLEINYVDSL